MYTAACCRHLAAKGYPITVVTPGNNVDEILRVVRELGAAVRADRAARLSAVREGRRSTRAIARGVDWTAVPDQAGAGRRGVQRGVARPGRRARTGMADPVTDSASLYGTADAGVLGNETPLSVAHPPLPRRPAGRWRARCSARRGCPRWCSTTRRPASSRRSTTARCLHRRRRRAAAALPHRGRGRHFPVRGAHGLLPAASASSRAPAPATAVRLRLRAIAVHGVVLRRQHLPGERDRRAGTAAGERLRHRQVRAQHDRGRGPRPAPVGRGRAGPGRGGDPGAGGLGGRLDPRRAGAAQQRVRPLRAAGRAAAPGRPCCRSATRSTSRPASSTATRGRPSGPARAARR